MLVAAASLVVACSGEDAPLVSVERSAAPSSKPTVEADACEEREVIESDGPVVDSLLALFDDTPIVAFGEHHGSRDEHRVLQALVCDPRFADVVDVVVVEFGNARLQDVVDRYVGGAAMGADELATVWRESTQRSGVWEAPVYRQFFDVVRSVNQDRAPNERVRVLAGDPPIDWATITATADCDQRDPACLDHWDREEHFATVVREEALDRGRTALLIAGAGHMIRRLEPGPPPSIPQLLERDQPGAVAVVLTHDRFLRDDPVAARLLTSGPAPALVNLARSRFGALDLCLVDDTADCARHTVADVADHYLYLGGLHPHPRDPRPAATHRFARASPSM